jgi:hypothetical protein
MHLTFSNICIRWWIKWLHCNQKGGNPEDNRIPLSALVGVHPIETTDRSKCTQTQHRHQAQSLCLLNSESNRITTWLQDSSNWTVHSHQATKAEKQRNSSFTVWYVHFPRQCKRPHPSCYQNLLALWYWPSITMTEARVWPIANRSGRENHNQPNLLTELLSPRLTASSTLSTPGLSYCLLHQKLSDATRRERLVSPRLTDLPHLLITLILPSQRTLS